MQNFTTTDLPLRTAVVCHDAGAANIVIASLLETGRSDWLAYMQGPAAKLWKAYFPEVALCDSLETALYESKLLVSGTGWASDVEHEARRTAQSLGIKSIAVIDHWINYAERFVRHGEIVLPDEFWVTDKYALDIALRTFPGKPIFQVANRYVEKQLHEIMQLKKTNKPELLYVLEPTRTNWGLEIPGEFQALNYFISQLSKLRLPAETLIRLRPHPSEPHDKYDHWMQQHPSINTELDTSLNIAESLGRATWVAGCESFALVLALMADRTVYCTLPPYAPLCRLPHCGLIHIRKLSKQL